MDGQIDTDSYTHMHTHTLMYMKMFMIICHVSLKIIDYI